MLGRSEVVRAYSDVPGRRAVWVDAWSAAGYLVPRAMLRHNGVDPERALAAQMFVGSYSGVIDALRARTADIGATFCPLEAAAPALVELPRDDASVSVIDVSDPIPPDAWCASSRLQSPLVDELRRLVLDATEGGAIAAAFGAAAFRPPDPAAYEMLSAALDDSP
ncbi:MAG: phosphate/phosphite/phosphonate ABC transporter substrate-binding protein [Sandaracinaceae bacterium]|nr:phosphate/phosphite/phosphonate ABC transporter substrate-binding protein [Sandaracinaceae bacterium]